MSAEEFTLLNCDAGEDLRVPCTAERSNKSTLKEIGPEYSLDGLVLKLKLQYFGHLMQRVNSLENTWYWERLRSEREREAEAEIAGWHHQLNGREFEWTPGVGAGQGGLACCDSWGRKELDMTERLNWTDAKAETPVLWPPHAKSWLIGKDSDAGRHWGQEEKETKEDEMVGWHHWLNGREFEWTPGDGDAQGGLMCCDSWSCKESDTTEQLNWTELNWVGPNAMILGCCCCCCFNI